MVPLLSASCLDYLPNYSLSLALCVREMRVSVPSILLVVLVPNALVVFIEGAVCFLLRVVVPTLSPLYNFLVWSDLLYPPLALEVVVDGLLVTLVVIAGLIGWRLFFLLVAKLNLLDLVVSGFLGV